MTETDWKLGNRRVPQYLLHLLEYKIRIEQLTDKNGKKEDKPPSPPKIWRFSSAHFLRKGIFETDNLWYNIREYKLDITIKLN